jgi:MSHA biogenesis protein MshP
VSLPAGRRCARPAAQAGFSLVAAIFLIVVLAALGTFAVQVAMTQSRGENLQLLESRAQRAAESGIEYGTYVTLVAGTCRANTTLRNQAGLTGFVVTVGCVRTSHQLGSGPTSYYVYALTASASYGAYGGSDYVVRKISRNVTLAPP